MYFLIAIWGDTNRRYAAYKFFIFTQAGGLLMLISILALYFINGSNTGTYTFDYFILKNTTLTFPARWIMLGFLIAFVIKLPVVPFHSGYLMHTVKHLRRKFDTGWFIVKNRCLWYHPFCDARCFLRIGRDQPGGPCCLV